MVAAKAAEGEGESVPEAAELGPSRDRPFPGESDTQSPPPEVTTQLRRRLVNSAPAGVPWSIVNLGLSTTDAFLLSDGRQRVRLYVVVPGTT